MTFLPPDFLLPSYHRGKGPPLFYAYLHLSSLVFTKLALPFWLFNIFAPFPRFSFEKSKNTALLCGVFAVHLFCQHILELLPRFELGTSSLPILQWLFFLVAAYCHLSILPFERQRMAGFPSRVFV